MTVIAEMLGVPADDMDRFESWSNDIALIVEPILISVRLADDLVDAVAVRPLRRDSLVVRASAVHQDDIRVLGAGSCRAWRSPRPGR